MNGRKQSTGAPPAYHDVVQWQSFWGQEAPIMKRQPAEELKLEHIERSESKLSSQQRAVVSCADLGTLNALLDETLNRATASRNGHREQRGTIRKIGTSTTNFVNNFSDYLKAYSCVVNIMRAADEQYGGVAYSALATLLIVGVNKKRKEQLINDALRTMQREYSRIELLKDVHGSQQMRSYIRQAFELGIEFSVEATRYYQQSTGRRVLEALTKPATVELEGVVGKVMKAFTEIEKERNSLDSRRLFEVQSDVRELKQQTTNERLQSLREHFQPSAQDLETYESDLNAAFANLPRWEPFSMSALTQRQQYNAWRYDDRSSLLLAYGKTRAHAGDCCWLSPAIAAMVPEFREQTPVVYYCCQLSRYAEPHVHPAEMLKGLVWQLLEQRSDALLEREHFEKIRTLVQPTSGGMSSLELYSTLLEHTIGLFPEIYILIDRVDRIKGDTSNWLDPMTKMLRAAKTRAKIFLIASSNANDLVEGKLDPQVIEDLREDLDDQFHPLCLDNA